MTWAIRKHILKYGAEVRTYGNFNGTVGNANFGNFAFNGSFTGNAYADFILGLPLSSTRLNPLINRRLSQKELGIFITDTFKVTPKLTLDYGLRWDRFSATTYEDGLIYNWDPKTGDLILPQKAMSKISPFYPTNINIVAGDPVPSPDLGNFVPRIGAAYRLNDKTVIRGGYGIFNEFWASLLASQGAGHSLSVKLTSTASRMERRCFSCPIRFPRAASLRTFLHRKSMVTLRTPRTG